MPATALTGAGNLVTAATISANNITLNKPANTADNDYLMAFVFFRNSGGTITTPGAEWQLLGTVNTVDETFAAYVKPIPLASAESATNYNFATSAGAGRTLGILCRVTGADSSTFQNAAGAQAAHTGTVNIALPAVTTTGGNKTLFAFAISNNTTTGSVSAFSPPGGMTTVGQVSVDNGTTATSTMWIGQEVVAASGSTGTRTPTISPAAANTGGLMIAVNASVVPPTVPAIADQIKANGSTASVTAVPTDPDGTVTGHAWTVHRHPSGTSAPSLTNANTATVTTGALSTGTTILQYVATDNSGLTSAPVYARLLVPAGSGVGAKPEAVVTNNGGWVPGGAASDVLDGLSGAGKWLVGPSDPTDAEITVNMEVPSSGVHAVSFYADWVENDGSTQASGVAGNFTAQVFQDEVAISAVKSFSNATGAPVQMSFTLLSGEEAALTDLTAISIQIKATQG